MESEDSKPDVNEELQARITITMTKDGHISFQAVGPATENKVVLLGLLELAKAGIVNQRPEPAGHGLLLPMGPIRRNGR